MKKFGIMCAVMLAAACLVVPAIATAGTLPINVNAVDRFVPEADVVAMGGDLSKPMEWTGDNNDWGLTAVEVGEYNGEKGVFVRGVGPQYRRWNLIQESYPRKYLRIEKAYPGYQYEKGIYKPGDTTPEGVKYDGTGIAFWN